MSKCRNCKIEILDQTTKCPLCKCVLDATQDTETCSGRIRYPNARMAYKGYRFAVNLVLFLSIVTACVCLFINSQVEVAIWWSFLVVIGLVYVNIVLRMALVGKLSNIYKAIGWIVIAVIFGFAVDYVIGYQGWALSIGVPIGVILIDVGILLLMIINRRNWQSYMMVQIVTIIISGIGCLLSYFNILYSGNLMAAALASSGFLFLGTLILGDRRARTELKRRFHV